MKHSPWRAQSIARPLAEKLDGRDLPLQVLSVHARACNLLSLQGDLIALVTLSVGNGPFHIVLADPAPPLHTLHPGAPASFSRGLLQLAGATIDLREAEVWDPHIPRPKSPIRLTALAHLREHVALRGLSPLVHTDGAHPVPSAFSRPRAAPLVERATWAAGTLLRGLRIGDEVCVARGAEALAGLGPGLTPAGDDFLVGLMAALHLWPGLLPEAWTPQHACRQIAQAAAERTTRLSAAWIQHAAVGEFGEPWHALIRALAGGERAAIRSAADRILNTGATSGADAMAGFLAPFAPTVARTGCG